jgi:hypothetical protein
LVVCARSWLLPKMHISSNNLVSSFVDVFIVVNALFVLQIASLLLTKCYGSAYPVTFTITSLFRKKKITLFNR